MARPAQVKRNNKYANKSKVKKGDIRLNLGENNHIDPKEKESGEVEDKRRNYMSGDLSTLLKIHYETRLRYNLLNLGPEFDGALIPII